MGSYDSAMEDTTMTTNRPKADWIETALEVSITVIIVGLSILFLARIIAGFIVL